MKRILSILLMVCLLLGISLPAHAENLEDGQAPASVVGTLEELRTAIDEAEVGDTIAVNQSITLDKGVLETDKKITLTRSNGFSEALLTISNSCQIIGFDFLETAEGSETVCVDFTGERTIIRNCTFTGKLSHTSPFLLVYGAWMATNTLSIENCSFTGNGDSTVGAYGQTDIAFTQCNFSENSCLSSQGGAVHSAGVLRLSECTLSNNAAASGGGIYCSGELTVSDCRFSNNSISNENFGKDIFCTGTLSLTNEMDEAAGFYEMTTGAKADLPLVESTTTAKLAYFTSEEAEEYFAPSPTQALKAANTIELLDAISKANDGDTIYITQPIWLDEGQDYTIGAPEKTVVLVFDVAEEDAVLLFTGNDEATVKFENLIITGNDTLCDAVIMGGRTDQHITLNNVRISGFICQQAPIVNRSNMTITNCTFEENMGRYGGHVYHVAGTLEISNCVFKKGIAEDDGGNQGNGGAIHSAGTLHFNQSSFIENSAKAAGAIYAIQLTECKISETSIIGNTSTSYPGGGIYAGLRCNLSLTDCEIYGNRGFQGGDDLYYRSGDIEISYTKSLTEVYTTTEKVPYSWMSNYAGQQAEEYGISIKGCFDNGLQLRFAFADEITVDDPIPEPTPEPTPTPDNDNPSQEPQEPSQDDDDGGKDYTPLQK